MVRNWHWVKFSNLCPGQIAWIEGKWRQFASFTPNESRATLRFEDGLTVDLPWMCRQKQQKVVENELRVSIPHFSHTANLEQSNG